ncbi:hypothetical protein GWE18_32975 [Bradyrhizobium sp. CSA112]|uniref:hypothetical protein n=1 Tax=Bradyrhizobium sp. CSA112 TaxID=2699170 RepID=UPI0023B1828F|nr:hypothetical protein [Bradyrhizobium sp. CSA112]MDE5457549.1 hypothetical protein [Bradyrhizobium sp. CSA112]
MTRVALPMIAAIIHVLASPSSARPEALLGVCAFIEDQVAQHHGPEVSVIEIGARCEQVRQDQNGYR